MDTRQEFVRAAITFLQNPKLSESSLHEKLEFLKGKGLNQVEIDEALNLALVNRQTSRPSTWNFLIVLGLCLGGYKLYQAYIEAKNSQNDSNVIDKVEHVSETSKLKLNHDASQPTDHQPSLTEIMEKIQELKRQLEFLRNSFGNDIQSLKTLLLGHEKFAAPPVIPAWQLKDLNDKDDQKNQSDSNGKSNKEKKRNKNDVNKGSSETQSPDLKVKFIIDKKPIGPTAE